MRGFQSGSVFTVTVSSLSSSDKISTISSGSPGYRGGDGFRLHAYVTTGFLSSRTVSFVVAVAVAVAVGAAVTVAVVATVDDVWESASADVAVAVAVAVEAL